MYTCTTKSQIENKASSLLLEDTAYFRMKKVMKRKSTTIKATKYHMCFELGLLIICPILPIVLLIRSDDMFMLLPISSRNVFWLFTSEFMSTESCDVNDSQEKAAWSSNEV